MSNEDILTILKSDIEVVGDKRNNFLLNLIELSKAEIAREGITLEDNIDDGMLIETYAAFLYRKRKGENFSMPRHLRYLLNNRLFSEKTR